MKKSKFEITKAKYSIGDLIHHKLFDYRGVIVDIDPFFQLTDDWYESIARSKPPKNEPWYHILVHQTISTTYVAEQNLESDPTRNRIHHPLLDKYFTELQNGRYVNDIKIN